MPRQGQSVETCILGQWYKSVGEEVTEGDILFSYETDKASFEEEAKESGILLTTFFDIILGSIFFLSVNKTVRSEDVV